MNRNFVGGITGAPATSDNQDIADAMDMLERSQDEQRQRLEVGPVAKGEGAVATNVGSQQCGHQRETSGSSSGNFAVTSRLHHVEDFAAISRRLHRGTTRPRKPSRDRDLSAGAGRGIFSEPISTAYAISKMQSFA